MMAEDVKTGLDVLIKQRQSRPSFARMISWEILKTSQKLLHKLPDVTTYSDEGQCGIVESVHLKKASLELNQVLGKGKEECLQYAQNLTNSTTLEPEEHPLGSDESEYFSAEEYNAFLEVNSSASASSENDIENNESDQTFSFEPKVPVISERKPRPSKKQKKKRRRQGSYIHYAQLNTPFLNVENLDCITSDLTEEINNTKNVICDVPSLFEICLRTLRSGRKQFLPDSNLPAPLKHIANKRGKELNFSSVQLSCLLHTLTCIESNMGIYIQKDFFEKPVLRNVWSLFCKWGNSTPWQYIPNLTGSDTTLIIPYHYASNGQDDYMTTSYTGGVDSRLRLYITSVLASIVDLMMPLYPRQSHRIRRQAPVESSNQLIQRCTLAVSDQLKKRFPETVRLFMNKAFPYIYWVRGHIQLALTEFLHLVDMTEVLQGKASYLVEAARMCRLHEQAELSCRLYRQAQDLLLESPVVKNNPSVKNEVIAQTLMLCANVYDNGLLSSDKALQALSRWKVLISSPFSHLHPESYIPALESILCYHLFHLPGKNLKEKLEGVLPVVSMCAMHLTFQTLHLSFVQACLSNVRESNSAYQRTVSDHESPGQEFKPLDVNNKDYNPWQPLLQDAQNSQQLLAPLHVVWRTQLGNLRVVKDCNSLDGDLCGSSLNLRLSAEGHLTGDFHLLLPSIRAINLDLYTGSLILPSLPGQTYVCKTLLNSRYLDNGFTTVKADGTYAVITTEVYSDSDGVVCHLVMSYDEQVLQSCHRLAYLEWRNSSGKKTKVNLIHLVKNNCKKAVEQEIKKSYKGKQREQIKEWSLKGLEYAFKEGLQLNIAISDEIGSSLKKITEAREWKKNSKLPESKIKPGSKCVQKEYYLKKQLLRHHQSKFNFRIHDFTSYGQTFCLFGTCRNDYAFNLFFDMTSKETFLNPVANMMKENIYPFTILGQHHHTIPHSQILFQRVGLKAMIFGQGGREYCPPFRLSPEFSCVVGRSTFGIHEDRFLIQYEANDEEDSEGGLLEHVIDFALMVKEVKVLMGYLLLVHSNGLTLLCPQTLQPQQLAYRPGSKSNFSISDDGTTLLVPADSIRVSVLEERPCTASIGQVAVAVNLYLIIISVPERGLVPEPKLEIVFCIALPGHAVEICFVSPRAGYLVSCTLHTGSKQFYSETVCQLSCEGELLAILPFLGPGPRDFCPLLLPEAKRKEEDISHGTGPAAVKLPANWHVYMRDGHEGIIAVRL